MQSFSCNDNIYSTSLRDVECYWTWVNNFWDSTKGQEPTMIPKGLNIIGNTFFEYFLLYMILKIYRILVNFTMMRFWFLIVLSYPIICSLFSYIKKPFILKTKGHTASNLKSLRNLIVAVMRALGFRRNHCLVFDTSCLKVWLIVLKFI